MAGKFAAYLLGNIVLWQMGLRHFFSGDHNMDVISTFPFFHHRRGITNTTISPRLSETQHDTVHHKENIYIGNDVWIGHGAVLFRGVTIGDGACIGAFSVITKDIPAYSVAVGHSRIVRKRFSQEDIDFLLELKWWDFPDSVVATLAPILHTPNVDLLRQWAKDHGIN